jgi:hypothetical protein
MFCVDIVRYQKFILVTFNNQLIKAIYSLRIAWHVKLAI